MRLRISVRGVVRMSVYPFIGPYVGQKYKCPSRAGKKSFSRMEESIVSSLSLLFLAPDEEGAANLPKSPTWDKNHRLREKTHRRELYRSNRFAVDQSASRIESKPTKSDQSESRNRVSHLPRAIQSNLLPLSPKNWLIIRIAICWQNACYPGVNAGNGLVPSPQICSKWKKKDSEKKKDKKWKKLSKRGRRRYQKCLLIS